MKSIYFLPAILIIAPVLAQAKLRVVSTTEDLAALTREVGGELTEVSAIAKGYMDPHFVDAKPSYLLKLKNADLFIQVGLELEVAWAPSLLTNARNSKILPGNPGFLDASEGCEILQRPRGGVDRSQGDVHPFGNPHYWLNPSNGRAMARSIAQRLSELDPGHGEAYKKNLAQFESKLSQKEKEWDHVAEIHLKGVKVVTYHNSWPNFAKRFGIEVAGFIEPKPGIPASPAHIQMLTAQIKAEKIPLILVEPYFDAKLPEKIAKETGAKLVIFLPSAGGKTEIKTYFDLFDYDFRLIEEAMSGSRSVP